MVKNKRDEAFKKREQEEKEQHKKEPAEAPAPQAGDSDEPMLSTDEMQKIIAKRLNEVSGDLDKAAIAKLLAEDFEADVKRRRTRK